MIDTYVAMWSCVFGYLYMCLRQCVGRLFEWVFVCMYLDVCVCVYVCVPILGVCVVYNGYSMVVAIL